MPVIALDPHTVDFYQHVNSYWLHNGTRKHENVVVLSSGGGFRDILVRDGLTILDGVRDFSPFGYKLSHIVAKIRVVKSALCPDAGCILDLLGFICPELLPKSLIILLLALFNHHML